MEYRRLKDDVLGAGNEIRLLKRTSSPGKSYVEVDDLEAIWDMRAYSVVLQTFWSRINTRHR